MRVLPMGGEQDYDKGFMQKPLELREMRTVENRFGFKIKQLDDKNKKALLDSQQRFFAGLITLLSPRSPPQINAVHRTGSKIKQA